MTRRRTSPRTTDGFQANVCLNYGGRDEIVRAALRFAEDYKAGKVTGLTEDMFLQLHVLRRHTAPRPHNPSRGRDAPSNFLMWESAYSELIFTDVLWPDFTSADIDAAIAEYRRADRRFGGIKK